MELQVAGLRILLCMLRRNYIILENKPENRNNIQ